MYKQFFPIFKEQLKNLFNFSLNNNIFSKSQKIGIINLIHKGGSKNNIENYRPITVLCFDYKLMIKILANRIRKVRKEIINEQTGGIKGRKIKDNLVTIRNILINNQPAEILSLDFHKAYDRVERNLVYRILKKIDFPDKIINNIKNIQENSTSKINVNGKLVGKVDMGRGVKQGCPLA